MPQYLIHPKHPIRTFVYIVLALGLVVGGFFTFRASQMSTEGRSKAALEYKTYVSWEFEGTDTEGWVGENLTNIKVGGGVLKGIVGGAKANPKLIHKKVSLDQGNKMFEISLAVAPAVKPKIGATPIVETYTLNVIYSVSPNVLKKKQLVLKGKTDGQMNDLAARFPEIGKLNIDNLVLEFVNLKSDTIITIASIKVTDRIGTKPSPTPTPPTCFVTLNNYDVNTPCESGNYRYVSYSCTDGYLGKQGSTTSCKSTSDWKKIAYDACVARKCVPTPRPITPTPTPVITPTKGPVSCKVEVYPATVATKSPYSYTTPIDTNINFIKSGDYYLYALRIFNNTNNKLGNFSAVAQQLQGNQTPLDIINTDGNCSFDNTTKLVKCEVPNALGPYGSALTSASFVGKVLAPTLQDKTISLSTLYSIETELGKTSCAEFQWFIRPTPAYTPYPTSVKACTQEAKLCPNGTYVRRTGPNCEFAPCPE